MMIDVRGGGQGKGGTSSLSVTSDQLVACFLISQFVFKESINGSGSNPGTRTSIYYILGAANF